MLAGYEFEQSLRRRAPSPRASLQARNSFRGAPGEYGPGYDGGRPMMVVSRLQRPESPRFATDHVIDSLIDDPYRMPSPRVQSFSSSGYPIPSGGRLDDPKTRSLARGMHGLQVSAGGAANPYAAMSPVASQRTTRECYPYNVGPGAPQTLSSPRAASPRPSPRATSPRPAPVPAAMPQMPPVSYTSYQQPWQAPYGYGAPMTQPYGMLPPPPSVMQPPTITMPSYPMQAPVPLGMPGNEYTVLDLAPGPLGASGP
jgi:hypothetical protein